MNAQPLWFTATHRSPMSLPQPQYHTSKATQTQTWKWPWRHANIDMTMAATATFMATIAVRVFSDLRKWRSEWWRPRARNLERGVILTLKRSNRRLGQEFSGIMMTKKQKEAIATTRLKRTSLRSWTGLKYTMRRNFATNWTPLWRKESFVCDRFTAFFAVAANVTIIVVVVFAVVWPGPPRMRVHLQFRQRTQQDACKAETPSRQTLILGGRRCNSAWQRLTCVNMCVLYCVYCYYLTVLCCCAQYTCF